MLLEMYEYVDWPVGNDKVKRLTELSTLNEIFCLLGFDLVKEIVTTYTQYGSLSNLMCYVSRQPILRGENIFERNERIIVPEIVYCLKEHLKKSNDRIIRLD